ncbi:MAG: DNA-3-methyladenine glycosylase [Egibacteraceae bacterium]
MTPLTRAFYARPAPAVAAELLGKLLVHSDEPGLLVARIVEVEAYTQEDAASHAFRGPTARNAPMFGAPGHAYVYFTYGMHWCLNVVTGTTGHGQGCLLRAAEPLEGQEVMRARRGGRADRELLRGPARLAQAYGLDGRWSGTDLSARPGHAPPALHLADDGARPDVATTARTGVAAAAEVAWRFVVPGSRWASPYKAHRRLA